MSKIIFITGTSTGFGKLTAITLSKEGHTVIAGMRNTQNTNADVAKELSALPNITVADMDVTDDASVAAAFEQALQKYGKIDVLVNNAAIFGVGLLEAFSIDRIRQLFEVNFYGILRTYQAVLPGMRRERSGLVINITSGASGHTLPFMIPYLATKFGVESITEGLQDELKQFGIDNVSIQPGVYPTEMSNGSKPGLNADREEIAQAYEPIASEQFNAQFGGGLLSKIQAFNMNPQVIADGILELINMKPGTRPLRYPLDAIAQGTDIAFINARADLKAQWLTQYGL